MRQTSHAQSHRGTVRKVNEDAFLELPFHGVWVVADGMGGHAAGDVASQLTIDTVQRFVECISPEEMSCEVLVDALKEANKQLLWMSETEFSGKSAGSTVVILFIKENNGYLLWAGDSRGYLLRNEKLTQVTKDHSQVNDMVDEGILKAEDAESHPFANVITRAVGVSTDLDVDIKKLDLQPEDVFLLCSDGLNKEVNDREIEEALRSGSIIDSGMALMHASLVRNARDNVTYILVKNQSQNSRTRVCRDDTTIPIFRALP